MKSLLLCCLILSFSATAWAFESQERLDSFHTIERAGKYKRYYAGVEQKGDKIKIKVTNKWYRLSNKAKEDFMKQAGNLFLGMGGARGSKESKALILFTFMDKRTGETVAVLNTVTGPEVYK